MKKIRFTLLFVIAILLAVNVSAKQRVRYTINSQWEFSKSKDFVGSQMVSIPHTWNAQDATDEEDGYYRGVAWYKKNVNITTTDNESIYVTFEGANQVTELFVNGSSAGVHKGGYTAFSFDISDYVKSGDNLFVIKVDNSHNDDIAPLSADFTFFGGIYRDVFITQLPKVHIFDKEYSSTGVLINTSITDSSKVDIKIRSKIVNTMAKSQKLVVESRIVAPCGKEVARISNKLKADPSTQVFTQNLSLDNPVLWSIDNPNLYKVYTRIYDKDQNELDCVASTMGVRWYEFDVKKGFFLNGEHVKLMGTNRHQFFLNKGSALDDAMHVKDIKLIKAMGGNFLRISHYPQDPTMLEMCDRLGIVVSVEIPMVNRITMSEEHLNRGVAMTEEMVYQGYNSPSVFIWAYMNEIMLRPRYNDDTSIDKQEYGEYTYKIAKAIDDRIKEIDPARKTMFVMHGNWKIYNEFNLVGVADIMGFNLYNGWYGGKFADFGPNLDKLHSQFGDRPLMVTEYGADVDPRIHNFDAPERFDFSCEYGFDYHKSYIKDIIERDFVAGTNIWNLNDFYSEQRRDAVPFVNNKGVTGLDRKPKDSYFLYQAYLNNEPMIHIVNSAWTVRSAAVPSDGVLRTNVDLVTNLESVELFVNGKSYGKNKTVDCMTSFDVEFKNGKNTILALGKDGEQLISTSKDIDYVFVPEQFDSSVPFTQMNVMMGSARYFEDQDNSVCWIPEKEYTKGSWGYVGGKAFRAKTRYGTLLGSSKDILGTENDPVYQTQRVGLEAFKADVPDGEYAVTLYFSELLSDEEVEALAYNLGNDVIAEQAQEREFDITINGVKQIEGLNVAEQYGERTAVECRFDVSARNGQGLNIEFISGKAETILNAIRIYKKH